jgi:4-hydroxybenzoate polyprenyltransferase
LFERKYGWVSFQTWGIFNFSAQNFSILEAEKSVKMVELFLGYSCFAFFSTLFREIVKDMEDMDGDAQTCRTLPIVLGKTAAKWVAFASGILFLLYAYRFVRLQLLAQQVWQPILFIFLIVLPWFWAFFRLFQAKEKADFTRLSAFAKIIMLSGLLLLLFYI